MPRKSLPKRKRRRDPRAALRKLVFRQVGNPGDKAEPAIADFEKYVDWLLSGKIPTAQESKKNPNLAVIK